jgi:hypothetical protein
VKSAFAVLHSETDEQVAVDMDYHRAMYDLCARVRPNETIVGWYSTGSDLNTYSALIQNFYSQETAPHQAVHVALNTGTEEGKDAGVKAYVRYVLYHPSVILFSDFISINSAHQLGSSQNLKIVYLFQSHASSASMKQNVVAVSSCLLHVTICR